jgi:hypothetical protein
MSIGPYSSRLGLCDSGIQKHRSKINLNRIIRSQGWGMWVPFHEVHWGREGWDYRDMSEVACVWSYQGHVEDHLPLNVFSSIGHD